MDSAVENPGTAPASRPANIFNSKTFHAFIIISIFASVLMYPFTFGGKALMPDTWKSIHPWARGVDLEENQTNIYDTVLEYGPWFEYAQECLKDGRVPHWNKWQFCGVPLYANRLIPFFYPPFLISLVISQPHKIPGWLQFFNLILSGLGMYLFLKKIGLLHSVAIFSSCLWLTCGVHFLPFPLWTLGSIWFPWLLWSLEEFMTRPGILWFCVASLIAGVILLVGYPVLIVHLSYFTAIFFLVRFWTSAKPQKKFGFMIPVFFLAGIFAVGFGISAIANVPVAEYSFHTVRAFEGFSDRAFEAEKRRLLIPIEEGEDSILLARFGERMDILFPVNGRGNQRAWQYGGIIVYFLALAGLVSGRRPAWILGVLWVLFAVPVIYPEIYLLLIDFLPGWNVTILLPVEVLNLIACSLAAIGLNSFFLEKPVHLVKKIIVLLLAAGTIVLTYHSLRQAPVINLADIENSARPELLDYSRLHKYFFYSVASASILFAAFSFLEFSRTYTRWIAAALIIAISTSTFWYLQPVYSDIDYQPDTEFTELLAELNAGMAVVPDGGGRITRWADLPLPFSPHKRSKSPFTPNIQMNYNLMDTCGYDSLVPSRYIDYCALFENPFIDYRALIAFENPNSLNLQDFRDMAVRYIITQDELPDEARSGLTLLMDTGETSDGSDDPDDFMQLWKINDPEPRAFLTRKVAFHSDEFDDPLVLALQWRIEGIEAVVIEDSSRENLAPAFPDDFDSNRDFYFPGSSVEFVTDDPEKIVLDVHSPEESYLVLRDGYYPEWHAYIDGAETEIYPADKAFRAVRIPEGDHTVEFRFIPSSFYRGMWISIVSLVVVLSGIVYGGRLKKGRPGKPDGYEVKPIINVIL